MIALVLLGAIGFANLTPDAAMEAAVARSPDVAAARARVDEAAAALGAARGALVPAFTAGYAQVPQGNPPGPNVTSRSATVGLQTNVADFVAYGPAVRSAELALDASRDDAIVATRAERTKVTGLYYDALKARAIVDARARALDLATAQHDAATKRFTAGDGPRLDVVRADVGVARATADLELARGANGDAASALALETGRSERDFGDPTDAATPVPAPTPADPDPAFATAIALRVRAEIASALAARDAEDATRRGAAASAFPALTVGAGYLNGTDSGVPVHAPNVNVALVLPLGGAATSRVRIERGRALEADARVENARRAVALEVGSAARNVGALRRAADASTRGREAAEFELSATGLGYRSGASSSLDVRVALATYAQALVDERSARYEYAKALALFALEVGP